MRRHLVAVAILASAVTALAGESVKRGAPISAAEPVSIDKVLAKPDDYATKSVVTTGIVEKACTNKGCWMQVSPKPGEPGVRVTFKDYKFFIPLDAAGMSVRMEGTTKVRKLSKKEVDHLVGEGAELRRNADGTANEVSFVATGVELER